MRAVVAPGGRREREDGGFQLREQNYIEELIQTPRFHSPTLVISIYGLKSFGGREESQKSSERCENEDDNGV